MGNDSRNGNVAAGAPDSGVDMSRGESQGQPSFNPPRRDSAERSGDISDAQDFTNGLRNPFPGAGIIFRPVTGSTMEDARDLMLQDLPHGTTVVTDYQEHGMGRKAGRRWEAPPGEALLFTVILRSDVPLAALSLRIGAAVTGVLEEDYGLAPRIKWPNDILLNGEKVCGILCRQGATWALVGIGLNVLQRSFRVKGEDGRPPATSLYRVLGREPDRGALLELLLRSIRRELAAGPAIERRVAPRLAGINETVRVIQDDGSTLSGVLRGLTDRGALRIAPASAPEEIREVYAGELVLEGGM